MSMFDNFQNIPDDYIPNNMCPHIEAPMDMRVENNNVEFLFRGGRIVGYRWRYGSNVDIVLSTLLPIRIEKDAMWSDCPGFEPDTSFPGVPGQKLYNTADARSWVCKAQVGECVFIWQEDEYLIFPSDGVVEVDITPSMIGKSILVSIKNFRGELLKTWEFPGVNEAVLSMTRSESEKFLPGVYTMTSEIVSDESRTTVKSYEIYIV